MLWGYPPLGATTSPQPCPRCRGTAAPRAAHTQEAPALAEGCGGQEGAGHRGAARWHPRPGSGKGWPCGTRWRWHCHLPQGHLHPEDGDTATTSGGLPCLSSSRHLLGCRSSQCPHPLSPRPLSPHRATPPPCPIAPLSPCMSPCHPISTPSPCPQHHCMAASCSPDDPWPHPCPSTPVPVLVPPSPSPSPCHPCPRVTPTPPCRARRQHEAQHDLARSRRGLPAGPRSPRGGGSSGRGSAEPNKAAGPPAPGHRDRDRATWRPPPAGQHKPRPLFLLWEVLPKATPPFWEWAWPAPVTFHPATRCRPLEATHPRGSRCQRLPGQVVKMSGSEPERPQFLFVKALASRGRLEAVTQQMGYHPRYLDSFLKTQHYLLHMDGPLPFDCRHYIAIMAAARHQCRYLVNLHVLQFLRAGGDPQWLRGLDFIPPKLRNLNEINKILAHRPWLITKEQRGVLCLGIGEVLGTAAPAVSQWGWVGAVAPCSPLTPRCPARVLQKLLKISEWSWSLAELVHAVVLLAHCHALASFVFGCGCEQEEGPGGRGSLKASPPGNQCFCEAATGNGCSQELLRINRKRSLDSCMELDSLRERIQRIHVETEGREETRLLPPDREEDTIGEVTGAANLACYMQDPDFGYQDFARRDEDQTQVFRVQDYSWEDHGFSLVNRLYSDIGHLLDEKFRMVGGLQSSAMAKRQGCEPSVFKRGIWNYIHCMFGIRYDDYDYAEVNHLLERMLKVYIKTVTCYPEKTNPEMFDRFWKQFKHSEKVHVNLLILEARMQAELLYALQAITQYMVS
uniref:Sestrin 3 n=1 Tax=Anas zonorhyncha TaxID=75864 RepID=A0A8B9V4P1_9AVES